MKALHVNNFWTAKLGHAYHKNNVTGNDKEKKLSVTSIGMLSKTRRRKSYIAGKYRVLATYEIKAYAAHNEVTELNVTLFGNDKRNTGITSCLEDRTKPAI